MQFLRVAVALRLLALTAISIVALPMRAEAQPNTEPRWFPNQAMPKGIVRTVDADRFPEPGLATHMMVQSVAGLTAKAVNEGRGDEMVWVGSANVSLETWYARMMRGQSSPEIRGVFGPWELVQRYQKKGIIKGYILYTLDTSKGGANGRRPGMDCSVNVATSMAGLLDGILVDQSLEKDAKEHGLEMLLDARDKTQAWCFKTYKDRFGRRLICTQDPQKANVRDLAIAQRAFTVYGDDEPTPQAMEWIEPLSPVIGWNGGDEFQTTRLSTVCGHVQTATDWCANLPVLMAGSERAAASPAKAFDPNGIDWNDQRSAVSFICSDGDNVQWLESDFLHDKSYWNNPARGGIPLGWSCCFAHLSQLCPQAVDYALSTQSPNDCFIEWGGGYYYPDLFALQRPDRWKLLAEHGHRTWQMMRRNNTRIIGFNVYQPDSADALKAYEVFAAETEGLSAILVFKYAPYEGGAGKTYWVKDRNRVELPVITARYSIWANTNHRPRSGTPAKVAREIRATVADSAHDELPRCDWVIAHAWSYFRRAPGEDDAAENLAQDDATEHGGVRGYTPVTWCAERLPKSIRIVGPEELVWRIRMKHNPQQTKKAIADFSPEMKKPQMAPHSQN